MQEERDVKSLAVEMIGALDAARLVSLPSERYSGLDFTDAYLVAGEISRMRQARGERPVGRKIGYTNRNIWAQYNMDQPIWGPVYAHTIRYRSGELDAVSVAGMVAPRIEPEIAFRLSGPVLPGCDDPVAVLEAVEWAARAFEIVDCHYTDWRFAGPDSVIDFAHHAALIVGEPIAVTAPDFLEVSQALRDCRVTLLKNGEIVDTGVGANALGHPLLALAHLADVIASQPKAPPLMAGEVITTGTLTAAMPVRAGEFWRTETKGLPFAPLTVKFA
jgi:2-oxo-3-hexenedioate decarboxylase